MKTRKQAVKDAEGYCWCLGYSLSMAKGKKVKQGYKALFTITDKKTQRIESSNISFDEVVAFVRRRVPEALLSGYESGVDIYEELHEETKTEQHNRQMMEMLQRAINTIKAVLEE